MKTFLLSACLCIGAVAVSSAASAKEYTVHTVSDYKNMRMYFNPEELHIKVGDTVTWVNDAPETHSVITYPDGFPEKAEGFASPALEKQGQKWSHKFTHAGTYEYHCIPHIMMGMRGFIVVGKPSTHAQAHKPSPEEVKKYRDSLLEYFDEDTISKMPSYITEKLQPKKP
ncbi:MAG TPA: plastocyanin/azurin family copper-binding protein [Rickettsiales bacterium]|nr:plastocyanin/azurin family copper-binding protein [Rickettsiales bacterium]